MKMNTSSIGRTERLLMSQEERIKKDNQLSFGVNMEATTRDGMLSILTPIRDHKRRDLIKNSDSFAINHSTLSQNSQCTELLKPMEPTTLLSTDMSREETTNNGHSTVLIRPSDPTTGRTMLWKSNPTVDHPISDAHPQSTQDGGNSSKLTVITLSTRKERS
jgi:hypothetical protein